MSEQASTFTPEQAEEILLPETVPTIMIGGREVQVLALDLYGAKAVFNLVRRIVKPYVDGQRSYTEARDQFFLAMGEGGERPDPMWFLDIIDQNLDDVYATVHIVLQRADPSITLEFVKRNLRPTIDLPQLVSDVIRVNQLEALLKKAVATEIGKASARLLAAYLQRSGSNGSPSTSPSTTESGSASSPAAEATTASPSASSSETGSAEISL